MLRKKVKVHAVWMPQLLAVLFVFAFNIVLLFKVRDALMKLETVDAGFVISIPIFLAAIFNIVFTLLCVRRAIKPLFIALMLLSSLLTYAMYSYGVIFDKSMIANIAQTNYAEGISYLNFSVLAWFLLLGVLPSVLLVRIKILHPPLPRALVQRAVSVVVSIMIIGVIAVFYFEDYASLIRNNPVLRKQVVPFYALDSAWGYIRKTYFAQKMPHISIAMDAAQGDADIGAKKELVVLVVGETQRAMNYELNGYGRATNAYTRKHGVLSFSHVTSCGTATAVSVPCMFSGLGREKYDEVVAEHQDNLLDIVKRTGVHVLWLDNDSGCKGVCKNVEMVNLREKYRNDPAHCGSEGCYDGVFLAEFEAVLKKLPDTNGLIVLHIMGSHGPSYYARYPERHRVFVPDCQRSDIQNCTQEELVNTYDNTILYSDYIISRVIDALKEDGGRRNSTLIFMSDHGESLGEKGIYLHGMPYPLAPVEQTHVPLITWMSDGFAKDRGIDQLCVRKNLKDKPYSHDNLFHTLLGLLDIRVNVYKPDMDIFSPCRTLPADEH